MNEMGLPDENDDWMYEEDITYRTSVVTPYEGKVFVFKDMETDVEMQIECGEDDPDQEGNMLGTYTEDGDEENATEVSFIKKKIYVGKELILNHKKTTAATVGTLALGTLFVIKKIRK